METLDKRTKNDLALSSNHDTLSTSATNMETTWNNQLEKTPSIFGHGEPVAYKYMRASLESLSIRLQSTAQLMSMKRSPVEYERDTLPCGTSLTFQRASPLGFDLKIGATSSSTSQESKTILHCSCLRTRPWPNTRCSMIYPIYTVGCVERFSKADIFWPPNRKKNLTNLFEHDTLLTSQTN